LQLLWIKMSHYPRLASSGRKIRRKGYFQADGPVFLSGQASRNLNFPTRTS
jgi:hypothetical protein